MPRILIAGGLCSVRTSTRTKLIAWPTVRHQIGAQVVLVALRRGYEVTAIVPSREEAKSVRTAFAQRLNEPELHNLSLATIPHITYNEDLNVLLKSIAFEAIIFTSIPFDSSV